ncbi:conserved hypothetical protein [Frankia canadensis]|uniref:Uncharacterized protein n=1 Tax=Frankia canadensis TaxID=1836972 RepID=A0A2I2KWJ8_9ACTN|nr:hypothetical protein [Frankia canadensis]SNQ50028.1 conserved hypothetical protein [Frankia canadensis]SOU57318.1 conserved hypothetical protein [Frankia canadensis]
MTAESDILFAVVLFAAAGQRTVRRIIAPFPDRESALAFARENGLRCFAVGPMHFAVPTTVPPDTGLSPTSPGAGWEREHRVCR